MQAISFAGLLNPSIQHQRFFTTVIVYHFMIYKTFCKCLASVESRNYFACHLSLDGWFRI